LLSLESLARRIVAGVAVGMGWGLAAGFWKVARESLVSRLLVLGVSPDEATWDGVVRPATPLLSLVVLATAPPEDLVSLAEPESGPVCELADWRATAGCEASSLLLPWATLDCEASSLVRP